LQIKSAHEDEDDVAVPGTDYEKLRDILSKTEDVKCQTKHRRSRKKNV